MAFDRIVKTALPRLVALAPAFALAAISFAAPAPAQAASAGVGVQTCTVVLFVEVCTGGGAGVGTGASPAPAPILGGSILSLAVLGGFVALRRRAAIKHMSEAGLDQPVIED